MENLQRQLSRAFWFTLALIFLFESWLWDHVKDWLRALGRALGVERFEPWLRSLVDRLAPPMTLALFAVPAILIFPFKLLALGLIATGHVGVGIVAIFLAKTLALGVTSFLFDICREKLLMMEWFAHFYSIVLDVRAWATALVAPYKARLHVLTSELKSRVLALTGGEGGGFARRLARLREAARRTKSV